MAHSSLFMNKLAESYSVHGADDRVLALSASDWLRKS